MKITLPATVAFGTLFCACSGNDESAPRLDASVRLDGPSDAAPDAAAVTDAGPPLHVLYASFDGVLVRIDPDTASLEEVGPLRNAAMMSETFIDVTMASDGSDDVAYAALGYHMPRLGTVDLCTALVTVDAPLIRASSPNLVVEGLARHPNGTWYVASGDHPSTLSSNVGTLDIETGTITNLGASITSAHNDLDMLYFRGATLYGVDIAVDVDRFDLLTIDLATGADTEVVTSNQSDEPLRVAYDESRGKAFAWRIGDRNLLEMNLETGAVTPIGETHPRTSFGNASIRAFFVAPAPNCD